MVTLSQTSNASVSNQNWALLLLLSVLWGGSFLFVGIAVKELPALLIVFARVSIAAAVLVPVHLLMQGALPRDPKRWMALAGMSVFNNVIPFTAIVYGQHYITAGLASVINATTPLFGAMFMALAAVESLTGRKIAGLLLGLAGVIVLKGVGFGDLNQETIGILAVVCASASYGISALWAKKNLAGIPPVTSATCQLLSSTVMMAILVLMFSDPGQYRSVSVGTWAALIGLAILSTSIAYLIFFRIIAAAGASVVLLVTMIIPVPAVIMGAVFLGERLSLREILGAFMICAGLMVIDGKFLRWIGLKA